MSDLSAKCVFSITVAGSKRASVKRLVDHLQEQAGQAFEDFTIEQAINGRVVMLVGKNEWSKP